MGTSKTGRWIVAVLVAAAVAAFLLLLRADVEPETVTASETRPVAATADSIAASPAVAAAAPKHETPRRVAASSAASKTGDAQRGTVVVHVTAAEDDAPIAGASVFVGTIAGKTDAAGNARFENLDACEWSFEASAPGRIKRSFRRAVTPDTETTIDIRLAGAAVIAVRVEDRENGAPVQGAVIAVDVIGRDAKDNGPADEDGERLMAQRAGSLLRVTATAYRYDGATTTVRLGGAGTTTPVVLRLGRPGRMSGVVRGPDDGVAAKAWVHVTLDTESLPNDDGWWDRSSGGEMKRSVQCDEAGRYAFEGLTRGRRWQARAAASDDVWAPSESVPGIVVPADGADVVRDFTLREFGSVVVRVTDDNGAPVANASVMVTQGNGVGTFPQAQGDAGTYRISRRSPGPIALLVWAPRGTAVRRVDVPPGGTAEVDVVLGRPDSVKCVVTDDLGRPVPGAKIDSQATIRTVAFKQELTTDAWGAAAVQNFRVGIRRLTVTAPGMLTATVETASDSTDDVRIVMQRAAVLTFRVLGVDGSPRAESARVLLGDDSQWARVTSAADGLVRLDCAPRGDVDVRLIFDTGAPVVRRATLAPGGVAELGDVRLDKPRRVTGRVVDLSGRPIEGAAVGMDSGTAGGTPSSQMTYYPASDVLSDSGTDGTFDADFAPPSGPLPIHVEADGFLDLHTVVTVDGDAPVTLTLQRGGLVWGEVAEASGAPLGGAIVRVIDARGVEIAKATAGPLGGFDVRVAPGRYTVRVAGCGDVSVELREGADEHVALTGRAR